MMEDKEVLVTIDPVDKSIEVTSGVILETT
jgi:hypothetical protein